MLLELISKRRATMMVAPSQARTIRSRRRTLMVAPSQARTSCSQGGQNRHHHHCHCSLGRRAHRHCNSVGMAHHQVSTQTHRQTQRRAHQHCQNHHQVQRSSRLFRQNRHHQSPPQKHLPGTGRCLQMRKWCEVGIQATMTMTLKGQTNAVRKNAKKKWHRIQRWLRRWGHCRRNGKCCPTTKQGCPAPPAVTG